MIDKFIEKYKSKEYYERCKRVARNDYGYDFFFFLHEYALRYGKFYDMTDEEMEDFMIDKREIEEGFIIALFNGCEAFVSVNKKL